MKKLSLLMCFVFAFSMLAGCTQKEQTNETEKQTASYEYIFRDLPEAAYITAAESFAGGNGTEADPYQISTAAELALMSERTNAEDNATSREYNKAYYKLMSDILLNDTGNVSDWSNTAPQYSWKAMSAKNPFTGSFDGNGHTISGLYINTDYSDRDHLHDEFGLFAENLGNISNLKITDSYICVSGYNSYIGSICGRNSGIITNCESSAAMEYYDATIGGIVGHTWHSETINENGGIISDCIFKGSIKDKRDRSMSCAGGIAGSAGDKAQIKNCHNYSDITADYENSNGIAGIAAACVDSTVDNCINSGNISGNDAAGGIIAASTATRNDEIASIKNCVNEGTIHGKNRSIAGIVGTNGSKNTIIANCKNIAEVSALDDHVYAAGIVAETGSGKLTIENCENTANIRSHTPAGIIAQATLLGRLNLEVKDCINTGKIISTGIYSAGIINNIMPSWDSDTKITVSGCVNKGEIETGKNAGGIIAFLGNVTDREIKGDTLLNIENCTNECDIFTNDTTGFIGGILGTYGIQKFNGAITNCTAKGKITFADVVPDQDIINTAGDDHDRVIQPTRIAGGIVGKIGAGIELALIRGEDKDNVNINSENGSLLISDCQSNVMFVAPKEEDYVYNEGGESIIINTFGGIVGYSSQEEGYAFKVENSFYSGSDCGLGNNYGADIGTKEN